MSIEEERRELVALAMRWELGLATRSQVWDAAIGAVEGGKAYRGWMALALLFIGHEPAKADVDAYFFRLLEQAGVPPMVDERGARIRLKHVLAWILDATIEPCTAARAIRASLLPLLPSLAARLNGFVADADDWDEFPSSRGATEDAIREDARALPEDLDSESA